MLKFTTANSVYEIDGNTYRRLPGGVIHSDAGRLRYLETHPLRRWGLAKVQGAVVLRLWRDDPKVVEGIFTSPLLYVEWRNDE